MEVKFMSVFPFVEALPPMPLQLRACLYTYIFEVLCDHVLFRFKVKQRMDQIISSCISTQILSLWPHITSAVELNYFCWGKIDARRLADTVKLYLIKRDAFINGSETYKQGENSSFILYYFSKLLFKWYVCFGICKPTTGLTFNVVDGRWKKVSSI